MGFTLIYCTACGKQYSPNAVSCVHCGEPNISIKSKQKSMVVALCLCIVFGTFGVHRFYLGKIGTGILMIIWFFIYFSTIWKYLESYFRLCIFWNSIIYNG